MTYATQADLEDAFGASELVQIADRDGDSLPDPGFLAAVLERADSFIDGYLAGRYALPLDAPYPPVIVATACDLARYWLYDDAAPERVKEAFDAAVAWLKDISAGRALLQLPAATENADVGSPDYTASDRVFSADTLADYG